MIPGTKRLAIYIGESDRWHHKALYAAILEFLKSQGCAGATAIRGHAGFGASTRVRSADILDLSVDLPIVIHAVDRADRIERCIPKLRAMVGSGLMTIEDVHVVKYTPLLRRGLPDLTVAQVMTKRVETVRPETPLSQVIEILIDKDYTALPVIDAQRRVVGMIGEADLIAARDLDLTLSVPRAAGGTVVDQIIARLQESRRTVRDVMKSPAVTIRDDESLAEAAHTMVDRGFKRLPVIDSEARLVGICSRVDLLKTMASVHLPQEAGDRRGPASQAAPHRIRDVMSEQAPTASPETALDEVIDLIVGSPANRVVVVDGERRPLGIVTDSDLMQRLDPEMRISVAEVLRSKIPIDALAGDARRHLAKIRGSRAADVMTSPVVTVGESTPFAEALAVSAERRIKRFPVVDGAGHLIGMVGRMELLSGFVRSVAAE